MKRCLWRCLIVLFFFVCFVAAGYAQDAERVYTSVALWDVPRAKWGDFVKFMEQSNPTLEKLLADGVIIEWGLDAEALHSPDGYTHSTWMSARSMADLEKAEDMLTAAATGTEAELASMVIKHMDLYSRSSFYGARAARLTGGYAIGTSVRVKRGEGANYRRNFEAWRKPVYDQLLADGVIVSYVLDSPYLHTDQESLGLTSIWYVVENMENDEKVDAAFEAARAKLSQADRDARWQSYLSTVDLESHRDDLTRLIHYQTK